MPQSAFPRRALGSSGLVFGTAGLGRTPPEDAARLLLHAHERGICAWEASPDYATYPHLAMARRQLARESAVIITKTYATNDDETSREIEEALGQLETDYIDVLLLHYTRPEWLGDPPRLPEAMIREKRKGRVRHLGVATHSVATARLCAQIAEADVLEAVLSRTGDFRSHKDGGVSHVEDGTMEEMRAALGAASAAGKVVLGMKVLGNGLLRDTAAQEISRALSYPFVDAVCVGMFTIAEVDQDLTAARAARPASEPSERSV